MMSSPVSDRVVTLLAGSSVRCRQWAEQDVGPYYLAEAPTRRDVTEDRDGVALTLGLALSTSQGSPLAGDSVEIWHCDAGGRYSGYPPPASEGEPGSPGYLADRMFLRGKQTADESGRVEFRTIYPGWYPGRTVHVHLIARASGRVFTSQLYFPDALSEVVLALPPYRDRPGRDTTNDTDVIFPTGGDPAVLDVTPAEAGYLGVAHLHIPVNEGVAAD